MSRSVEFFRARLDLLEEADQISSRAREWTGRLLEGAEETLGVKLDEANGAMFVTHVAMALTRVERDESESTVPGGLLDELGECEKAFAFVRSFFEECGSSLGRPVPEAEIMYTAAHLCALSN